VDVGCGIGTWAAEFSRLGVTTVLGVDGAYVDRNQLKIPADAFIERDLVAPIRLEQRFDLAISLEVAEHLPSNRASSFVRDLTDLAPAVVFSAAIPFQGGTHHINERWATYWSDLFEVQGFRPIDCVRPLFWNDTKVEWWYRQNMMLYVSKDSERQFADCHRMMPLDVVHPELLVAITRQPGLRFLLKCIPGALKRTLKSRILRK
jgi:hypothetical protein